MVQMLGLAKCAFTWGCFSRNEESGGASFLLRSLLLLLLSNDSWDLGLWALGGNTFLYLAFLKQPAIR